MKNKPWFNLLVAGAMLSLACSAVSRVVGGVGGAATAAPTPVVSTTDQQLAVFDVVFADVRDQYVRADFGGVDWATIGTQTRSQVAAGETAEAFAQTLRDMLAKLPDGGAIYQTRAERVAQDSSASTSYSGIGAYVSFRPSPQPHIVILSTIAGAPAANGGLQPHDSVLAVDGTPFTAADAATPTKRVRGEQGTAVTLTVQTPGEQARQVLLQRAPITSTDGLRGGNLSAIDVAYYRLPVVADTDMAAAIAGDLANISQTTQLKGIVLDLRIARSDANGWPLTQMLTLFTTGKLGEFYTRAGATPIEITGQDVGGSQTLPLVVMIGSDTAGTPEIFAAALQASRRAMVVGQASHGSVLGFNDFALPDGSRLTLGVSSYRTSTNIDMVSAGVTPDRPVDADWGDYTTNDDPVLAAAFSLLPVTP